MTNKMKKKNWNIFMNWLNSWGDFFENPRTIIQNIRTEYGDGYQDAIRDVYRYIQFYNIKGK